jgi:glycosyltransferase involved in cell wall biosynthesis
MLNPTVSVCIPTYNGEEYLKDCLDSVLSQTFSDFEVLIVDDQSSDQTLSIAKEYADQDPRIQIVQNPKNLGLVGNWNRCIELAQGEWIKFVFQDDLIAPMCLEKMLEASQPESSIICCRRDFIFDDSTPQNIRYFYEHILSLQNFFSEGAELSVKDFCQVILSHIGYNFVGEPTAVMLRRNVFYRFGTFNPHLIQICDLEFWTRIAVHTGIIYIDEPLATFRLHGQSTSSKNHADRQYRVDVLDPLTFLHDLVLHPLYAPLRAIAATQSSPIDLKALLRQRAYQARKDAQRDPALQEAWSKVLVAYPALADLAKANVIMGLTYDSTREFHTLKQKTKLLLKSQLQRQSTVQQPQTVGK